MIGQPKIVYDAGAGPVTLQCVDGPKDFHCYYKSRVHDNVATSGYRERVFEHSDMLISFTMPAMTVGDALPAWNAFMTWALQGGTFNFYPNSQLADYYHCVVEGDGFDPVRVGPGRYSATFTFRIVPDAYAPGDPAFVLQKFYGV